MKQFNSYDNAKVIGDYETLPKGNYICKVMGVKSKQSRNGGEYLEVSIDIAEGEYKGFYENDYRNNPNEDKKWRGNYFISSPDDNSPEWMKDKLKTFVNALEDSNNNYHWDWDENKWKGLIFGGKFRIEEFKKDDGTIGSSTRMAGACPVDMIRNNKAKLMKDKLIKEDNSNNSDEFISTDETEVELPF